MTVPHDEQLDLDRIDALYRAHVSPMVFRRARAVERPTAIFVGAQPGAGKSSILTRLRGRFRGNVALISGDDFRQFHPAYARLRDTDPVAMPNVPT